MMKDWRVDLISVLENNGDGYISGEELARTFDCTRAAIWKKINILRKEGYPIEAVTNQGYRFLSPATELENQIKRELDASDLAGAFQISVVDQADSTNQLGKNAGARGEPEGQVFIAIRQLKGRGRRGKQWVSDNEDGLWFSLLLRPPMEAQQASLLTLLMGVCVLTALKRVCGLDMAIKWPNDIVALNSGKKVAGILTEASLEDNRLAFMVVGCGINLSQQTFPLDIEAVATSLAKEGAIVTKLSLINAILGEVSIRYPLFLKNPGAFIEDYRQQCATLGRLVSVRLSETSTPIQGTALNISDQGDLVVRLDSGQIESYSSGEVSVRGLLGYS